MPAHAHRALGRLCLRPQSCGAPMQLTWARTVELGVTTPAGALNTGPSGLDQLNHCWVDLCVRAPATVASQPRQESPVGGWREHTYFGCTARSRWSPTSDNQQQPASWEPPCCARTAARSSFTATESARTYVLTTSAGGFAVCSHCWARSSTFALPRRHATAGCRILELVQPHYIHSNIIGITIYIQLNLAGEAHFLPALGSSGNVLERTYVAEGCRFDT